VQTPANQKRIPTEASALLDELSTKLPALLARNLVGIYLYGSITNSSFNPRRSDLDCIVVTRRDPGEAQFRKLDKWLKQIEAANSWTKRLQMSFLVKDELLRVNTSGSIYQFGVLRRCGSDGNPIIWLDHLRRRQVILGPPADSFLPEITTEIFSAALRRELGYLREELSEESDSEWRDVPMYRAYAVLTVCRILYSWERRTVVSKPVAAKWALRDLPAQWRRIIQQALDFNETGRETDISLTRIRRFLEFAVRRCAA
jgi:hypothetical protein